MEFVVSQREAHVIATLPLSEEEALYLPKIPKLHLDPFAKPDPNPLVGSQTANAPHPAFIILF